MSAADLTEDTFDDEDDPAGEPISPKHADDVEAASAVVGLDHAEHAVQLPADEEDDEEMVGVPKLFKPSVRAASAFLDGEPNHDPQGDGHDPSGHAGSGGKVEDEELGKRVRRRVLCEDDGEHRKVVHMGDDVHGREEDDGPSGGDMELDVVIKGNNVV